ncbi:phosphatidate cytidylyltransferase [Thiohalomonas denitrificans]|uniref:Phosphatidate cytidylyltransferase n=1 Tax=Thiohalomonas denitrificans TaxID=415747 RepID=A0A1G5Q1S6_9GAMM|nr:phosphatidate cytidylyltransferase [Thiohalomonas denitrificans]SCZ55824.1 phosphatidate cytidylyltransferase [Thiohalomonas denitrificans]
MLKQRILTALILAPLAVWAILALPSLLFALLLGVIMLLGAWEWTRLIGLKSSAGRIGYTAAVALLIVILYPLTATPGSVIAIGLLALVWWSLALVAVVRYPEGIEAMRQNRTVRAVVGVLVLVPAWGCLVILQRAPGPGFVLLLMVLIWGADTGAYFAGRRWGRHRLAARVSPGKTWEGVVGGAAVALTVGAIGWFWLRPEVVLPGFLLLCAFTIAASVLGDLSESMFKRMMKVKDSGGLLPGHGGILDRIDSLTAAAPVFVLGFYGLRSWM